MATIQQILEISDALQISDGVVIPKFVADDLGVDARLVGRVAKVRGFRPFKVKIGDKQHRVLLHPRSVRLAIPQVVAELVEGRGNHVRLSGSQQ